MQQDVGPVSRLGAGTATREITERGIAIQLDDRTGIRTTGTEAHWRHRRHFGWVQALGSLLGHHLDPHFARCFLLARASDLPLGRHTAIDHSGTS